MRPYWRCALRRIDHGRALAWCAASEWALIAGFSALLLLSFIIVIAARAQLGFLSLQGYAPTGTWLVVAYSALGCVANAATPSKRERRLWLPVVACMLASSLTAALS